MEISFKFPKKWRFHEDISWCLRSLLWNMFFWKAFHPLLSLNTPTPMKEPTQVGAFAKMSAGAFTKHKLCPIKNSKSTSWCSCEDVSCCVCGDTNFIGVPPAVLLNIRLIGSWIRQEFAQIQHLAAAYRNIYSQIRSVYAGGICRGFKMITLKFGQFWIFVLHWALFHKTGRIYTCPIWGRTIWPHLQNLQYIWNFELRS